MKLRLCPYASYILCFQKLPLNLKEHEIFKLLSYVLVGTAFSILVYNLSNFPDDL